MSQTQFSIRMEIHYLAMEAAGLKARCAELYDLRQIAEPAEPERR